MPDTDRPSEWQSLEGHVGTAAVCRLAFEKSIWTLARAAMIRIRLTEHVR